VRRSQEGRVLGKHVCRSASFDAASTSLSEEMIFARRSCSSAARRRMFRPSYPMRAAPVEARAGGHLGSRAGSKRGCRVDSFEGGPLERREGCPSLNQLGRSRLRCFY
jgi:hypothetical protein